MTCEDSKKPKKRQECLRKTNLLVYEKPAGLRVDRQNQQECKSKTLRPPICVPRPKHIRVCTGAEMKRMCPPKVCVCPQPKKSRGLTSLLMFGVKSAIAAAAIYVTYDMGIWGPTEETEDLYKFICGARSSPTPAKIYKWEPPSCDAEKDLFTLPRHDPFCHCNKPPIDMESSVTKFQSCWNKAVWLVFSSIANFPGNLMKEKKKDGGNEDKDDKEEDCIPYDKLDEQEREAVRIKNKYK